jgi:hypothetical protein
VNKVRTLSKILCTLYISFALWFLLPILVELLSEPPEGDEIGLLVLLSVLFFGSFLSIGLWFKEDRLNDSTFFKWSTILLICLVGILVFLFTYSTWMLLVSSLAVFYLWIKRIVQRKITILSNLTWISLLSLGLSIYVFFQLIP